MELYRLTGALTGFVLSGGISLYFFLITRSSKIAAVDVSIFYLLIPPMVLFGFLFDTKAIWKKLMKISKLCTPSYIGSGIFWTFVWPFCKLSNDLLYCCMQGLKSGAFILPPYFSSLGINGILGFFLYQAMVGSGMGIMFFMAYTPVFTVLTKLKKRLGHDNVEIYELTLKEEFAEFGLHR
jgi:hypothetical protein